QAYVNPTDDTLDLLDAIRLDLRDNLRVATTLGYGPRFLHSTGQFHKGGPNTGHFIQFTTTAKEDAPLPGRRYTFGMFRDAQALGDRQTLEKHGRHVIRIHLGEDRIAGIQRL